MLFLEFIDGETQRIHYSTIPKPTLEEAYSAVHAEANRLGFVVDETKTEITIGERMGLAYLYVVGQKGIEKLHADIVAQDGMCVSTDTTREDHLIVAFSDLLCTYGIRHVLLDEAADRMRVWRGTNMRSYEPCEADYHLLEDLFDLMEALAPEGFWFGSQEGDGACFGFWRAEDLLYEGEEARIMWQKYARQHEVLARIGGQIIPYAWPGGHPMIYWHQAHESSEIFPLCAGCTREHLLEYGVLWDVESGDLYDHDLPCDQCGQQLAAYYEEGD
jgi:hypothetical protein